MPRSSLLPPSRPSSFAAGDSSYWLDCKVDLTDSIFDKLEAADACVCSSRSDTTIATATAGEESKIKHLCVEIKKREDLFRSLVRVASHDANSSQLIDFDGSICL